MNSHSVAERLARGPVRGLGCANEIASEAVRDRPVIAELVSALRDERALVVLRAANALKKVQTAEPRALDGFGARLVREAVVCTVLKARWSLLQVLGRLRLKERDRALAVELLFESFADPSGLVRTFALQSLMDLSREDAALRRRVRPMVQQALENGTPAMRARARRLLPLLKRAGG